MSTSSGPPGSSRSGAAPFPALPVPPYDVVVVGAGRVGSSFARALERAGHRVLAELRSTDDPSPIAEADVVVIAVPDDALPQAVAMVARLGRSGAVVTHACGLSGVGALADCGELVAAIHPAMPIPERDMPLDCVTFGVTCAEPMREWCDAFVRDLGGRSLHISDEQRPRYHAALGMASHFSVALAGDAAEILGEHETLVPLLRAAVDNVARLGPDHALTGPIVRGDAGTVRGHLNALPQHLVEPYVVNARRVLARLRAAGRLDPDAGARIEAVLDEAVMRA